MRYYLWDFDGTIIQEKQFKSTRDIFFSTIFDLDYIISKDAILNILKNDNQYIVTFRFKGLSTFSIKLRLLKDFYKQLTLIEIINLLFGNKIMTVNQFSKYKKFVLYCNSLIMKQFSKRNYQSMKLFKKIYWRYFTNHKHVDLRDIIYIDFDKRNHY